MMQYVCWNQSVFPPLPLSFHSQLYTLLGLNIPEEEEFGIYCFGSCNEKKKNKWKEKEQPTDA